MAAARGTGRVRRPLSAPAVRRHAQAREPGAGAGARSRHHPDGRTVLRAGHPDAAADGERSPRAVARPPLAGKPRRHPGRRARLSPLGAVSGASQAVRKAVLFITHDLDEAIAMSDRVMILSAGPGSRVVGEFRVDLERPRDVAEIRATPRFVELQKAIGNGRREEVPAAYQQQLAKAS